jgi:hypothetical protein
LSTHPDRIVRLTRRIDQPAFIKNNIADENRAVFRGCLIQEFFSNLQIFLSYSGKNENSKNINGAKSCKTKQQNLCIEIALDK